MDGEGRVTEPADKFTALLDKEDDLLKMAVAQIVGEVHGEEDSLKGR